MGELAKEGKLDLKVRAYYQIFETCEEPLKEIDRAIEYAKNIIVITSKLWYKNFS